MACVHCGIHDVEFAVLASDQIINHASKMLQMSGGQFSVPIVFRGPNGTAATHTTTHSQSYESLYASMPGLKVVTPFTPYEAKGLLKSAIRDNDPVLVMESEKMYGDKGMIPEGEFLVPIGKANIRRKGDDVTIVSLARSSRMCTPQPTNSPRKASRPKSLTSSRFARWTSTPL